MFKKAFAALSFFALTQAQGIINPGFWDMPEEHKNYVNNLRHSVASCDIQSYYEEFSQKLNQEEKEKVSSLQKDMEQQGSVDYYELCYQIQRIIGGKQIKAQNEIISQNMAKIFEQQKIANNEVKRFVELQKKMVNEEDKKKLECALKELFNPYSEYGVKNEAYPEIHRVFLKSLKILQSIEYEIIDQADKEAIQQEIDDLLNTIKKEIKK